MSARPIGELLAPILLQAVGLARLHEFLSYFHHHERLEWIANFVEGGTITREEADILLECLGESA
jgi:hypothetical protein